MTESSHTFSFIIRTIFVKPENAINVPEKYRKLPSQSKPTETPEVREEEREEERETYDIDPRQAGVADVDLSKVNVSHADLLTSVY